VGRRTSLRVTGLMANQLKLNGAFSGAAHLGTSLIVLSVSEMSGVSSKLNASGQISLT
jgi:hypothetical protein